MISGFFSEHQEQLKGYVNTKELGKAIFNSGSAGLLVTLATFVLGNIAAHADAIFPNPYAMGLATTVIGMVSMQLRSLGRGKTVIPTATETVPVLPENAPVSIFGLTTKPADVISDASEAPILARISGKDWYYDPKTGAAFESDDLYASWKASGSFPEDVPGGRFVEEGGRFVYTVKSAEGIHYETRTDTEDRPVLDSEGKPARLGFSGDGVSGE